jgi:hypothetical protein
MDTDISEEYDAAILTDPEDVSNIFLRIVGVRLEDYMVAQTRSPQS